MLDTEVGLSGSCVHQTLKPKPQILNPKPETLHRNAKRGGILNVCTGCCLLVQGRNVLQVYAIFYR
jgi:hypothetical protein